jgi:hypothetical protein
MKNLRGKRVLVTVPELKKSAIEISAKDEEMMMQEAMKKWEKIEVFAVGNEVEGLKKGDMVYVQTYALESGEKISIDDHMRILVPENAIAIIW